MCAHAYRKLRKALAIVPQVHLCLSETESLTKWASLSVPKSSPILMSLIQGLQWACHNPLLNVTSGDWTRLSEGPWKALHWLSQLPSPPLSCLWMCIYIANFPDSSYSHVGRNDKVWGHHDVIKYLRSWSILIYGCTLRNMPPFSADHFYFPAKASWKRTIKVLSHWPWDCKPWGALIWRNRWLLLLCMTHRKCLHFLHKEKLIWKITVRPSHNREELCIVKTLSGKVLANWFCSLLWPICFSLVPPT